MLNLLVGEPATSIIDFTKFDFSSIPTIMMAGAGAVMGVVITVIGAKKAIGWVKSLIKGA